MTRAALSLSIVAVAVAALDLGHKAAAVDHALVHERSALWILFFGLLVIVEAVAIVLTRSTALGLTGGLLVGGCAGNLVSAAVWGGVPDPIALAGIHFSVGDALIGAGIAVVLPVAVVAARRDLAAKDTPETVITLS